MNLLKKATLGAAVALALSGSAYASPINVGGVVWDPDAPATGPDKDFTARVELNQWFTSGANAVADTLHAAANPSNAINPGTVAPGDVLQGVGEVFKLNGTAYGNTASLVGGAFCPSCELTFTFGGFTATSTGGFAGGWLRLYVDDSPDFNLSSSGAGAAADGTLFLELRSRVNEFSASSFSSGFLLTYFDVVDGIAKSNFDTNTKRFATDLLSSAGATFNDQNVATADGQIFGNTIPEPASLALVGLGLLGLGALRRRSDKR